MRLTVLAFALVAACNHHADVASGTGSGSAPTPAPPSGPPPTPTPAAVPDAPSTVAKPSPADAPDVAPVPASYFESQLCLDVMAKIEACKNDPAFASALDAGLSANDKKANAKLRADFDKNITKIHDPHDRCDFASRVNFEHGGFFDHWEVIASASDALATCASLGTAIAKAGGMAGGDIAN